MAVTTEDQDNQEHHSHVSLSETRVNVPEKIADLLHVVKPTVTTVVMIEEEAEETKEEHQENQENHSHVSLSEMRVNVLEKIVDLLHVANPTVTTEVIEEKENQEKNRCASHSETKVNVPENTVDSIHVVKPMATTEVTIEDKTTEEMEEEEE